MIDYDEIYNDILSIKNKNKEPVVIVGRIKIKREWPHIDADKDKSIITFFGCEVIINKQMPETLVVVRKN